MCMHVSVCTYTYIHLSLSLSLCIYIYIYVHVCTFYIPYDAAPPGGANHKSNETLESYHSNGRHGLKQTQHGLDKNTHVQTKLVLNNMYI